MLIQASRNHLEKSGDITAIQADAAWQVAAGTVREFLQEYEMRVILTAFDRETALLGEKVLERG